ncbi:hypothetical protein GCM10007320_41320 [Pseudorhodoferax aquiterrae]|uniref:Uncharacterized protein n=1 Tax=Pseudorhodoferax aquiterrae TaxID=747304 RepID=A0ABQ3G7A8_9BURK|nr:hypothetical protein GCM10007320_41320 [Pseudorhodoferax aquiterrae]
MLAQARERDDGNAAPPWLLAHAPAGLVAAHERHPDVHQHHVGQQPGAHLQRLGTAVCGVRGVAVYAAASANYRLADMLTQAWQLGWVRAELARELSKQHAALQRHLRLFGSARRA